MATRYPLVLNGTAIQELQDGDTLKTTALYETKIAMAANNIDVSTGNLFTKTISGATTFTVNNVPASGTAVSFILDLTNGGSSTITWWSSIKWSNNTAPTLSTSSRDILGFFSYDGGTTWSGLLIAKGLV